MSKELLPFSVGDISGFARSLRRQIDDLERTPGHVEMLNMVSKAGGFRNFQHFRAQQEAWETLQAPRSIPPEVDFKLVKRLARFFDQEGRLIRWPKKFTQRMICLWTLWMRLPTKTIMTEREISDWLKERHLFGDHALLRREMADRGMVERTADGRQYKRIERRPPAEAGALLDHLRRFREQ